MVITSGGKKEGSPIHPLLHGVIDPRKVAGQESFQKKRKTSEKKSKRKSLENIHSMKKRIRGGCKNERKISKLLSMQRTGD